MKEFDWKDNIENKEEKIRIGAKIAEKVKDGDVIGFGSGSTSYMTILEIAKRMKKEGLKIKAIPTSKIIEDLCHELNIKTCTVEEQKPDWCFDGADEVDKNNWLIKGMGAALYKEKLNIKNCKKNYILVDNSKFVEKLGQFHPVPVECDIDKIDNVKLALLELGSTKVEVKMSKIKENEIFITDNGKAILYTWFDKIEADYEEKINNICGVLDNGLFIGYNYEIVK